MHVRVILHGLMGIMMESRVRVYVDRRSILSLKGARILGVVGADGGKRQEKEKS